MQFVELPPLVRQGTLLPVKAVGRADVAGVKEVRFFVGAPPADGKLPPGTATVAGEQLDSSGRAWGARMKLPADRKGPLDLGVQFVSSVGLVTFAPDDIDWADEVRIAVEERASFSPDGLTGLEANYRVAGPETMETKIFGRLSAWQNWIFYRPNASGADGALRAYGTGRRASFDRKRA